jgi:hypothetical protein
MRWSIPERRGDSSVLTAHEPVEKLVLFHRNTQTRELLLEIFATIGVTVVPFTFDPMDVDGVEHDAVFLDMDFFEEDPALCLKLLGSGKRFCIVLYTDKIRGQFFKAVSEAENVILVRRPLAIHRIAHCLKEPSKYIGGYIASEPSHSPAKPNVFEKVSLTTERQEMAARLAGSSRTIRFDTSSRPSPPPIRKHQVPMPKLKRVLMVEDNEVNGKMGIKLLSISGYEAELAEDGAVALDMITKPGANYDIVLMDCQVLVLCSGN